MADGRRTRWVAHDVYFLDEGLGEAMFDRFGGVGIALWHGFIAACKKNHVEGQTSWASTEEALTVLGLPGMHLVDNDGEAFKLDDWLQLLSDHKVIRRTSRGRRLKVACTKWARWQQSARRAREADKKARDRAEEGEENGRSDDENASPEHRQRPDEESPDTDTDTDTDKEHSADASDYPDETRELCRLFATEHCKPNGHGVPDKGTKSFATWLREMDRLRRIGPPNVKRGIPDDEIRETIAWMAGDTGNGRFPGWSAVCESVPTFREKYRKIRAACEASNRQAPTRDLRVVGSEDTIPW